MCVRRREVWSRKGTVGTVDTYLMYIRREVPRIDSATTSGRLLASARALRPRFLHTIHLEAESFPVVDTQDIQWGLFPLAIPRLPR